MTANDAGVGTHRFRKGILGAFDGIFHLRGRKASLLAGFHLEGNGTHPRKQHHAKSVDQLERRLLQIGAFIRHTVIDPAMEGIVIERFHGIAPQMLRQRLKNILGGISAGGQSVDGIGVQRKALAFQRPHNEIPRIAKETADALICDFFHGLPSLDSIMPGFFNGYTMGRNGDRQDSLRSGGGRNMF